MMSWEIYFVIYEALEDSGEEREADRYNFKEKLRQDIKKFQAISSSAEGISPVSLCAILAAEIVLLMAVITGAEEIQSWQPYEGNVWVARVANTLFGDYNPYTTYVYGDWYFARRSKHTGCVYLNGKALYEADSLEACLKGEVYECSWEPEASVYKWYAQQEGDETVLYANFQGADPNRENVEINVRRECFMPSKTGVNYITVSGFTVTQAATTWAPPAAYQDGMIGPHWSKGWIIEDCELSDSKCSGISLGKYYQPENDNKWLHKKYKDGTQTERECICLAQIQGWTKENIGHHIIRRCNIHDCGQTGIVGHLGGVFSLIEDNHIHHINNKQNLSGAEIGGIKMHAAIDVVYRRNHIHHCTRGIWLDWQAQGTRVTQNLFHHNTLPTLSENPDKEEFLGIGDDIFVEVSHGPTLIDNNILLSTRSLKLAAQGIAWCTTSSAAPSPAWPRHGQRRQDLVLLPLHPLPCGTPHRGDGLYDLPPRRHALLQQHLRPAGRAPRFGEDVRVCQGALQRVGRQQRGSGHL